ncbi:MAG: hypothetical protein WCP32_18735, partial [Bacteroidota bacterium]
QLTNLPTYQLTNLPTILHKPYHNQLFRIFKRIAVPLLNIISDDVFELFTDGAGFGILTI